MTNPDDVGPIAVSRACVAQSMLVPDEYLPLRHKVLWLMGAPSLLTVSRSISAVVTRARLLLMLSREL